MAQLIPLELFEGFLERAAEQLNRNETHTLADWMYEFEHLLRTAVEEWEDE